MLSSRRRLSVVVAVLCLLHGLAGGTDCPTGAIQSDTVVVQTSLGKIQVDVCLVIDATSATHVYEYKVTNLSVFVPLTSLILARAQGVDAMLEGTPSWSSAVETTRWIWQTEREQGIYIRKGAIFRLRTPASTPIGRIPGTVWPVEGATGRKEFSFEILGPGGGVSALALQATSGSDERLGFASLCGCSAVPGPALRVAAGIRVPTGYRAEYLVPPSLLNMPTDVAVREDGSFFVNSGRNQRIFLVDKSGAVSEYASGQNSYSLDVDAAGNLYSYNFPAGEIYKISRGRIDVVAEMPITFCTSVLAAAPDGTLYVGHFSCGGVSMGTGSIWEVPLGGKARRELVSGLSSAAQALDVGPDGILYALLEEKLCSIDIRTGARTEIATLPFPEPSPNGLVVVKDGAYVSTGGQSPGGKLYRLSLKGDQSRLVATFVGNGVQGIAALPNGDVIGAQSSIGGLVAVRPSGEVHRIIEPNGLVSPQSVAVTSCGELVVVNDEARWMSVVCRNGMVKAFASMISFQPPLTRVACSAQGWIVAGESAPGFPPQLVRYGLSGERDVLAGDLLGVSGVAVASDGTVFAAATDQDRIVRLLPSGQRSDVATDLRKPQALALSPDGTLYAIINQKTSDAFEASFYGDTVVAIAPDGKVRVVANVARAYALALDELGILYVAADDAVRKIDKSGTVSTFASGFEAARGIAYAEGVLYVTDDEANAIVMIARAAR